MDYMESKIAHSPNLIWFYVIFTKLSFLKENNSKLFSFLIWAAINAILLLHINKYGQH